MSRSSAVCIAAVLFVSAADAQQARPRTSPPQAGATTPSANQGDLPLAQQLVSLSGMSKLFDPIIVQFNTQIRQRAVTRPELGKDLDQVLEVIKPELEKQKDEMVDAVARYYAAAFTEAELKDMIAFAKTPTGQKYLQLAPRIHTQLDLDTRRWAERVSELAITRVRAELGKRGHQF